MFNNMKGANPMAMLKGLDKVKQAVREGGEKFETHEETHTFQSGVIEIKTRGDNILNLNLQSDKAKEMLNEDAEMFEDVLCASINQLRVNLMDKRTEFIIERAKQLKVPKQLIQTIDRNNILDMLS